LTAIAPCRTGKQEELLQVVDGTSAQCLGQDKMECTKAALIHNLIRGPGEYLRTGGRG